MQKLSNDQKLSQAASILSLLGGTRLMRCRFTTISEIRGTELHYN